MTKRTSTSYVMTVDFQSTSDMEKLQTIKDSVRVMNQQQKELANRRARITGMFDGVLKIRPLQFRVCVKGRKPITKVNGRGYAYGGNVIGGLKNSSRGDVYIYERG